MLIADVYAEIMQMMKYNLQPTVNIPRAQVTKIHFIFLYYKQWFHFMFHIWHICSAENNPVCNFIYFVYKAKCLLIN